MRGYSTFVSDYSLIMNKRAQIIQSALTLFSKMGFDATSTSKVAEHAGVSEGLIFRHFENKLGLLTAVMQLGGERVHAFAKEIQLLESPQEQIQTIVELPFHIQESEYPFWKLMYSLKWQNQYYDSSAVQPIRDILIHAFKKLKYSNPEIEADLIGAYMDGFATTLLLKYAEIDKEKLLNAIRKKHKWTLNK